MPNITLSDLQNSILAEMDHGRRIGELIESRPESYIAVCGLNVMKTINTFGTRDVEVSPSVRYMMYETLAYIDPNLLFAAPGPGMCGLIVQQLGTDHQRASFDALFERPTWTFFALTEPATGSDFMHISLTAKRTDNGFQLNGEKYIVGNGVNADVGVVFARSQEGPLGIDAFLVRPSMMSGLRKFRLSTVGCPGANLSHLVFDRVEVEHDALLGAHLPRSKRLSSIIATFGLLRPCVAGAAIGIAKSVLDRVNEMRLARVLSDEELASARLELESIKRHSLALCIPSIRPGYNTSRAGMAKVYATLAAERTISKIVHKVNAKTFLEEKWLNKAWRDVKAFEYTEGVHAVHLLNSLNLR